MPDVSVTAAVPGADADRVFVAVADFAAYPRFTGTVREVVITAVGEGVFDSAWEVNFRNGVLAWTERDTVDVVGRRIVFAQTDGDFAEFTGTWQVNPTDDGARVHFTVSFDLGMPSLAPMIDPIAERTLVDNIRAILTGLFGESVTFA